MHEKTDTARGETNHGGEQRFRRTLTLTKVLPTDRLSFEKQVAIARAFAAVYEANGGNPVSNEKAGETVTPSIKALTVVQVNAFFGDVGLVNRSEKGGFVPGPELIAYNKAAQWGESAAKEKLRPLFERTWFYKCLAPRLQLAPQPGPNCIAMLAEATSATKEHAERLQNLLKFLALAGIISITGGMVSLLRSAVGGTSAASSETLNTKELPGQSEIKGALPKPEGTEEHTLYLDGGKQRRIVVNAPLSISQADYDRLCNWLKYTLIIQGDESKRE